MKSTWVKLLLAAHATVAIENLADVSILLSRNNGQWAELKILLPLEPLLLLLLCSWSFTNWLPSRSWDFWLLQIPGLHTSLSQRHPVSTCHHCSVSPLCWVDIVIQATTGQLAHRVWGGRYWPWIFCTCVTPSPVDHLRRSGLISASAETLKIVNSFPGHCWKSCAQRRVSEWVGCSSSQVFCYLPEVTVWSVGIGPPPRTGLRRHCSGHWMGRDHHWVVLNCSPTDSIGNENKLMENKQFVKKIKKKSGIFNLDIDSVGYTIKFKFLY